MSDQNGGAAAGGDQGSSGNQKDPNAGASGAAGAQNGGTIADGGQAQGGNQAQGGQAGGAAQGDTGGAQQGDWRSRMASGDKDALARLGRFADEGAFFKSYRALESRLSSGELKKALPEAATPEEVAAWRKDNGIPEKPEGYTEKMELPNGLVLGEADKPVVNEFAKAAHEMNVAPAAFNKLVAQYYAIQDQQRAQQEEADATFKQKSEDDLRSKWQGADFRQNLTAVSNMLSGWPEGLATSVLAARGPDGHKLGDNPAFVQTLAQLARELNPAATLVPNGSNDPAKSVDDRITEIRRLRSAEPDKYAQNQKALEAEEMQLIDAQLRMKKRAAA